MTIDPLDVVSLVADDALEQIQSEAAEIVQMMLTSAKRTLTVGTPADKAMLTKSVLPAILREMQAAKEDDGLAELREQHAAMMTEVREGLRGPVARSFEEQTEYQRSVIDSAPTLDEPTRKPARKAPAKKPAKKAPTTTAKRVPAKRRDS